MIVTPAAPRKQSPSQQLRGPMVLAGTDIPAGKSATVQFTTKATGTAGQVLRAGLPPVGITVVFLLRPPYV